MMQPNGPEEQKHKKTGPCRKGMGIADLFGRKDPELVLDIATLDKWPERLLRHQRIPDAMASYLKEVERRKRRANEQKSRLADARIRNRFPERALPIYDEHLPGLLKDVESLLAKANIIDDVFLVEEQQKDFQEALTDYRELTERAYSALREFAGQELLTLNERLRDLEDAVLSITPVLEERSFPAIKELKEAIHEFTENKEKEAKLKELKKDLLLELDNYEGRRLKIKERIRKYTEQARNPQFKELLAEEDALVQQQDDLKVRGLSKDEEDALLKPVLQRLVYIRKQMINDITALNINEQRAFLDAVKDDILLRKKKLERVDELLDKYGFASFRTRLDHLVLPFRARIEDLNAITEPDDEPDGV